tara:strand:+ start:880 stop:2118 length:1239 start_codon:yes stop_codon:yes gene_type:complete
MALFDILGGFAEEGRLYFDEKEKSISDIVGKGFDKWLVDGPANFKSHRAKKKALRTLAKRLEGYNLSNDKIGVILEQGRGDEVLTYLNTMSTLTDDAKKKFLEPLGGDISNIVKFAPDYEESGLTIDQIVNRVGGKITGGMSLSDAYADLGQSKESTLGKLFSPNVSRIAEKRKKMYESVYGKGALDQARTYATGSVTSEDLGFSGTIGLPDPVASKAVLDTLEPSGGYISESSFNTQVKANMASILGTSVIQGDFSVPKKIKDVLGDDIKNELMSLVNQEKVAYNKALPTDKKGTYTDEFLQTLRTKMQDRVNAIRSPKDDEVDKFSNMKVPKATAEINRYKNIITNKSLQSEGLSREQWFDDMAKLALITGVINKEGKPVTTQKMAEDYALEAFTAAMRAGKKGSAVRQK